MAGSIGGNNAHAANIVTAIYIATGQVCLQFLLSHAVTKIKLKLLSKRTLNHF